MRTATLKVLVSARRTRFDVVAPGATASYPGPPMVEIERLERELGAMEYTADAPQRARLLRRYVEEFLPPSFISWCMQWIDDPTTDSVLCVQADDATLSGLPWEQLLMPAANSARRGWVVRVCGLKSSPPPPADSTRMLLAAWPTIAGYPMPGVTRELQEFPAKFGKQFATLMVLSEPTRKQLLSECENGASWVHLSPPSLIRDGKKLAVPVTVERRSGGSSNRGRPSSGGVQIDPLPLEELCKALKRNKDLQMVLLNACHAGNGCGQISRALDAVAVGWPALVGDDVAADFTFYYYQRLFEGSSPLSAVRSFARAIATARTPVDIPVVWLPSPKWVEWQPLAAAGKAVEEKVAPDRRAGASSGRRSSKRSGGAKKAARKSTNESRNDDAVAEVAGAFKDAEAVVPAIVPSDEGLTVQQIPPSSGIRLEFRPRSAINPALLVNGLHPIEHINIESPTEREVHLCITCDTGADTSVYRQTVRLRKGIVPVTTTEIHFPALHELIERQSQRRRISFTATLHDMDGREITGQTRASLWMGAKEWLDQQDNWAFIPAFVNPFDDGVLKVFEFAKKVLRTLGHPADSFNGYRQEPVSAEFVATQMKAIFQTLRDDTIGLTYISPPGSPVFDSKSQRAIGQVVRTHGEVIERRLGTCHDLALLLAACAEYVGIRPLLALIPGHTFFGYWTTAAAQQTYWKARESRLRTGKFGEGWTMTDGEELLKLVNKRQITLVEATYVCQREKTFDEACVFRTKELRRNDKHLLDVAIDVYAARREVQPV